MTISLASQANVLLFILGLMGLAGVAEESGALALVAEIALRHGGGSLRRLFVVLFLAGALLTTLLSNDATAIVFTPIVYRALSSRSVDPMPFLIACAFVANTASFGLPFANPANVLVEPRPEIAAYVAHLAFPEAAALAINLGLFMLVFRRALRGRYSPVAGEEAHTGPVASRTLAALGAVAVAYAAALALRVPLGPVALAGAAATLVVAGTSFRVALRHVTWGVLAVLAALFAVVDVLADAGCFTWALHGLDLALRHGTISGIGYAAAGTAVVSAIVNNLPVAVVASYAAAHVSSPPIGYALVAGVDLGPNLSVAGSLATIIWIAVLRRRGLRVNVLQYTLLGALVVPPMLAFTVLWLAFVR